ncbi:MAG TPA: hypothetical protein VMI31_02025, partial [Fimbriimonadaceae bacterium]|nr:hypothetical protein [Fimbriimonadaceae bacterium]
MKRIAISALAVVCLSGLAFGQDNGVTPQYNATINSGPWHMRRMTGNRTADKLWFIMDHTLNSAEMLTLNTMFNSMPQNEAHDVRKAILHAIKKCSDNDPQYSAWWPSPGEQGPHISDDQIFS